MSDRSRRQAPSGGQLLAAYLFADWHLRRMPKDGAEQRRRRAVWCRDHCNTFTTRWYVLGVVAWFLQVSPLGQLFLAGGAPILALCFLLAFLIGTYHLVRQIAAQERAGPPPIEPPVDIPAPPRARERDRRGH